MVWCVSTRIARNQTLCKLKPIPVCGTPPVAWVNGVVLCFGSPHTPALFDVFLFFVLLPRALYYRCLRLYRCWG